MGHRDTYLLCSVPLKGATLYPLNLIRSPSRRAVLRSRRSLILPFKQIAGSIIYDQSQELRQTLSQAIRFATRWTLPLHRRIGRRECVLRTYWRRFERTE
ncbi:hypothetical protein CBS115989_2703 [Aspergillus niger]|nr:hypothetical protein CBS115989_2703 [Aspergillus niger]KAI2831391.1 hypothetical protein CBS133816_2611 [Aspergillus niger]KAI2841326.1 hypothetical protein CBS11350_6494 [Aspergillus niger]KAI2857378.1 hypothetical protein CBS11232_3152 [Aspergillus niger]KAI2865421.1 hypothetical protein CBS12448_2051 [Aspergillus niger]